jgi:7-carboxy-7-deazaguanine synthase
VCLTGGEPLLQAESVELVRALGERGYTTVIETGGSLDIRPYLSIPGVIMSVDVKCPSSKMESHNRWANLPMLRPTDVEKFVIQDRRDYLYARRTLKTHPAPAQVVFQPVWGTDAGRLADWVLHDHLDVRTMLQEHKVLWGDVPGR